MHKVIVQSHLFTHPLPYYTKDLSYFWQVSKSLCVSVFQSIKWVGPCVHADVHHISSTWLTWRWSSINSTLNVTFSLERILGRVAGRLGETEALKLPQPKVQTGCWLTPSSLPQISTLHSCRPPASFSWAKGDTFQTRCEPLLSWRPPWAFGPGTSGRGCALPELIGSCSCPAYLEVNVVGITLALPTHTGSLFSKPQAMMQHQAQGFQLPPCMTGIPRKSECK